MEEFYMESSRASKWQRDIAQATEKAYYRIVSGIILVANEASGERCHLETLPEPAGFKERVILSIGWVLAQSQSKVWNT
jgi:hypothetical protein